jgi:uncharacterized membrane protein
LQTNGFPVIVFTVKEDRQFIVIDEIIENQVDYYSETGRSVESLDEFLCKWTGIALYAVQDGIKAELELKKNASEKRLLRWRTLFAAIAGFSCMIAWCVSVIWSLNLIVLFTLCMAGVAVSILLTMHEFGESNRFLHKVCHLNRLTNCNAVLSSSAAKLFGWLSMSDIGLFFFMGSFFALILSGVTHNPDAAIPWLLALAFCSFPYTIFSLWYQTFKVKQYCPMCLGVISILWMETAFSIFRFNDLLFFPVSLSTVFILVTGFSLPIITWAYVKPLWKEYNRIRNYEYHYLRLKRSPEVLRAKHAAEPVRKMEFVTEDIHLGTSNAPMHITVVMSMYCQPCIDAWNLLIQWLTIYPGLFWLTVRFHSYTIQNNETKELIDGLTCIYMQSGKESFCDALTFWCAKRDFQNWKSKYYGANPIPPQQVSLKNAKWEHANFITAVPTVFVNDRIFPFEFEDIEYMLKDQKRSD